ncbi:exonuclease domain-containing protein [Aestuariibius sp. HNIBRBA575]|uniref:3'-5' exonuclease n=1 Tax=Aestuariibius sp. HNIBRBA575 TaxID=3233343 RepID=UPI0034A36AC7
MHRLSLRFRILLFFALIGVGGGVVMGLGLWMGYRQLATPKALSAFVTAGAVSVFGLLGLAAGIWLLFDENVARPLERLAAQMRARAHGGVGQEIDVGQAKYLGDLAPAMAAVTHQLTSSTMDTAQMIAQQTASLAAEKEKLAEILTGIPTAVMIISPAHLLVLYDGQAAEMLAAEAPARLNASLFEYLDQESVAFALEELENGDMARHAVSISTVSGKVYTGYIRSMGQGADGANAGYMLMLDPLDPNAERPLTYDFDLLFHGQGADLATTDLRALSYVVFDTETTGLDPKHDDIVQIGAVRVVNGKIVAGEVFDMLVDPGRPIPAASTKVHKITDDMVQGALDPVAAVAEFARFAEGAVLVAHNAPFDVSFLKRYGAKMGLAFEHPVLDTVLLSAVVFGAHDVHTLDALSDRLSVTIPPDMRHTALGDAVATAQVLSHLLPILAAQNVTRFGECLTEMRKHQNLVEDLNA